MIFFFIRCWCLNLIQSPDFLGFPSLLWLCLTFVELCLDVLRNQIYCYGVVCSSRYDYIRIFLCLVCCWLARAERNFGGGGSKLRTGLMYSSNEGFTNFSYCLNTPITSLPLWLISRITVVVQDSAPLARGIDLPLRAKRVSASASTNIFMSNISRSSFG